MPPALGKASLVIERLFEPLQTRRQVGAYLLTGLPGQSIDTVKASIQIVKENGITPIPAHYSPIPGSALWPKAVAASRYDLTADPLYTNNAIQPCRRNGFDWQMITDIKRLIEA